MINDEQANAVRVRISGAVGDLCAVKAKYHKCCYTGFTSSKNVKAAKQPIQSTSSKSDNGIQGIVDAMTSNPSHGWTSVQLYELYIEQADTDSLLSWRKLKNCLSTLEKV